MSVIEVLMKSLDNGICVFLFQQNRELSAFEFIGHEDAGALLSRRRWQTNVARAKTTILLAHCLYDFSRQSLSASVSVR